MLLPNNRWLFGYKIPISVWQGRGPGGVRGADKLISQNILIEWFYKVNFLKIRQLNISMSDRKQKVDDFVVESTF